MKILLISESSTEDDIYRMIDQIIKIDKIIETHDISEELSYITDIRYDIIIINYDKVRIRHGDFKMIFDIRCKTQRMTSRQKRISASYDALLIRWSL